MPLRDLWFSASNPSRLALYGGNIAKVVGRDFWWFLLGVTLSEDWRWSDGMKLAVDHFLFSWLTTVDATWGRF